MLVDGKQYHIGCKKEDIGKYVILPGDPGRCKYIAEYLDNSIYIGSNREYTTYTGTLLGEKVTVMSTGMGGPSTAIGIEELVELGAHTFIRVGTCGGIKKTVVGGDLVIATGSVRQDGTGREYLPIEYPAVADFEVVTALNEAAIKLNLRKHIGVVQCKDSFYGQHRPETMPVGKELMEKWEAWIKGNVLASEMESSTLFIVSSVRGTRAGTVLNTVWNQELKKSGIITPESHDTTNAINTAVEAMKILITKDKETF